MKCPRCHRDKMTSAVSQENEEKSWPAEKVSFKDEHDRTHVHMPDEYKISYTCSNGHKWTRKATHPCWCGWSYYMSKNIAAIRVFLPFWCWVGEDNFLVIDQKAYKAFMEVRLETSLLTEADEIKLENEAPFYSLLRGA